MSADGSLTCQDKDDECNDGAPLFDLAGIKVMFFLVAPITQLRAQGHERGLRTMCSRLLEAVRLVEG
jgi:hypothetical protein